MGVTLYVCAPFLVDTVRNYSRELTMNDETLSPIFLFEQENFLFPFNSQQGAVGHFKSQSSETLNLSPLKGWCGEIF